MSDKDLYEALLQAVCDEPDVPLHKLALADYFGERGDELRQAAWQKLSDRNPYQFNQAYDLWWFSDKWEDGEDPQYRENRQGYEFAVLNDGWVRCLNSILFPNANWRYESNRLVYVEDLLKAMESAVEGYVVWKGGNNK